MPWTSRQEIGILRAYWRTVGVVMFRQRRFRNEMVRPVDYHAAQKFRWLTIVHAGIPVFVALVVVHLVHATGAFHAEGQALTTLLGWTWPSAVVYAGFLLFLIAATAIPSYMFQMKGVPVRQQNRAIALSYYASGPIALVAFPLAALGISSILGLDRSLGMFSFLLGLILPWALLAIWWLDLIHLTRRLLPQQRGWAIQVAVLVPVSWFFAATLFVGGLLWCVGYVGLMCAALQ